MKPNEKPKAPCSKRSGSSFPHLSSKLGGQELVKVLTDNGSVLVSNDQAVEYMYNQHLEGAGKIRVIMPTGEEISRKFATEKVEAGSAAKPTPRQPMTESPHNMSDFHFPIDPKKQPELAQAYETRKKQLEDK